MVDPLLKPDTELTGRPCMDAIAEGGKLESEHPLPVVLTLLSN